jgi:hypothetical protein
MTDTVEPNQGSLAPSVPEAEASQSAHTAPPKSQLVKKLLRRGKGATLAELQEATAWQPHSVRAFLSGLRKKGLELRKEQRRSGETAYRLATEPATAAPTDA